LILNCPSSGHELFEAVLAAEEALSVVCGHIQQTVAEYSCNLIENLEKYYLMFKV
jgi:hypothetical protein